MSTEVLLVDEAGFAPHVDAALELLAGSRDLDGDGAAREQQVVRDSLGIDGQRLAVALDGGTLVGFAQLHDSEVGQPWHDDAVYELALHEAMRWFAEAAQLAQVLVRPDHRCRGIGRALVTAVVDGCARQTVLAAPDDPGTPGSAAEGPGLHLAHALGFVDLLRGWWRPGSPVPSALVGRRLRGPA